MSEWLLLAYLVGLIACLMVAARLQPKSSPAPAETPEPDGRRRR